MDELQVELLVEARKASAKTLEEAVLLRRKSRTLRAESRRLRTENEYLNYRAASVAGRALALSLKPHLA